ncbi:MAG: hypothetical protein HY209_07230 [Candidatus Omnitrophica bacterium]|nr:hypothetical protein [Candidatus Omnitrophota bacterium]
MMKFIKCLIILYACFLASLSLADGTAMEGADLDSQAIFDDRALITGYTDKFADESKDVLLAMIADDSIGPYKCTAAVRVFKQKYGQEILSAEKAAVLRVFLRRLNRTDSPFVRVEIMHTLIVLDHYQYFASMMPILIQKLDHYNAVVRDLAYEDIGDIIKDDDRPREARIVFNTLRKIFFLSRHRLNNVHTPDEKLKQKLSILRWAIRVLGTQELKRLPFEVIRLL